MDMERRKSNTEQHIHYTNTSLYQKMASSKSDRARSQTNLHILIFNLGETDAVIAEIERGVMLAHENIPQNPERTAWRWNIESNKTRQTHGLACFGFLKNQKACKQIFDITRATTMPLL